MNISLHCITEDGRTVQLSRCLQFTFVRERYQPFAALHIRMFVDCPDDQPVAVRFFLGSMLLHEGIPQKAVYTYEQNQWILQVSSRSYTAALTKNQLVPGIYSDLTLQQIMETYQLPQIVYDNSMQAINYIYVKDNAAMWDTVIAYNYKLCKGYPYIRVPNMLCMMPQTGTDTIALPMHAVLKMTEGSECSEMFSRIDMANATGEYGSFSMTNPEAVRRGIVRVRQMLLDRQYLFDPDSALSFRIAVGNRKLLSKSVTYAGYCFEDIEDLVQVGELFTARVSRITVSGNAKGIVTTDTFYFDPFCNVSA